MKLKLDNLHPEYQPLIIPRFVWLDKKYPWAKLRTVSLYKKPGDRSLGYTEDFDIYLNSYWFARHPPALLKLAAIQGAWRGDKRVAPFHGGGAHEPDHVIIHEFGHIIENSIPKESNQISQELFNELKIDPTKAVTGYALANKHELFAEYFSLWHIGNVDAHGKNHLRRFGWWLAAL